MTHELIRSIEQEQFREVPEFGAGDTVRVHAKVVEGTRERIQVFEGIVIRRRGGGIAENFTVRRIASHSVGVERTFLIHSPRIDKIEVTRFGKVRRAARIVERRRDLTAGARKAAERAAAEEEAARIAAQEAEQAAAAEAAAAEIAAADAAEAEAANAEATEAEVAETEAVEETAVETTEETSEEEDKA